MPNKKQWVKAHQKDHFVKKAKREGLGSRAAYKLIEIQKKYHLIKPGMTVLELGAAPGSWTQIVQRHIGKAGKIIAIDRLPLTQSVNAIFIQGDITDVKIIEQLSHQLQHRCVDVVLSDMAPNLSGQKAIDQPRMLHLLDTAFDIVQKFLVQGGSFLFKLFQGAGSDTFITDLRSYFGSIKRYKPSASRAKSREFYVLARAFHSPAQ
jgi:23S rRNA (uridine2552-2'-O)-methyltransferase